jgi:hypothetical protein
VPPGRVVRTQRRHVPAAGTVAQVSESGEAVANGSGAVNAINAYWFWFVGLATLTPGEKLRIEKCEPRLDP